MGYYAPNPLDCAANDALGRWENQNEPSFSDYCRSVSLVHNMWGTCFTSDLPCIMLALRDGLTRLRDDILSMRLALAINLTPDRNGPDGIALDAAEANTPQATVALRQINEMLGG